MADPSPSDTTDTDSPQPTRSRLRKMLWRVGRVLLVSCLLLTGCVMFFENQFIYFPIQYPEGEWDVADIQSDRSPRIEDTWLTTSDDVKIHGWYVQPPKAQLAGDKAEHRDGQRMVVLWLHGNAGNISHRYELLPIFTRIPADVFIIDYRGYGRSEGSPHEQGVYRDARAAWDHLTQARQIPPDRIVLFGKSLGGAVAIELATQVDPAGLIVESAFTSIKDMAAQVMPVMPSVLIRHRMASIEKVDKIECPKLFIHGSGDTIVPFEQGQRLYQAAAEPKSFYEVDRGDHNDTSFVGGEAYLNNIATFIRDLQENRESQ